MQDSGLEKACLEMPEGTRRRFFLGPTVTLFCPLG